MCSQGKAVSNPIQLCEPLFYYYINLARSRKRRDFQENQAKTHGLLPCRIQGVEPPLQASVFDLHKPRLMYGPMDDNSDPNMANAIVLSFVHALRRCVADAKPFFFLAEDDTMLLLDFQERLDLLWAAAPTDCEGLCLHSSSLAIETQLMNIIDDHRGEPPLVHRQWPKYSHCHIWAPHEVICNAPLIFLLSGKVATKLLDLLEGHLHSCHWSPIDWMLREIIARKGLPIYLVNPAAIRLVGSPFESDRHPNISALAEGGISEKRLGGCVAFGLGGVDY